MAEKRVIDLGWYDGLGLIIQHPSGVLYSNQVGGHGCFHPEVEGVFFPLQTDINRSELNTLEQHFRGSWDALNEFGANLVDTVLQKSGRNLSWISVDPSRLNDSFEAWVYVKLKPKKTKMDERLVGFDEAVGVLTWPNSD